MYVSVFPSPMWSLLLLFWLGLSTGDFFFKKIIIEKQIWRNTRLSTAGLAQRGKNEMTFQQPKQQIRKVIEKEAGLIWLIAPLPVTFPKSCCWLLKIELPRIDILISSLRPETDGKGIDSATWEQSSS